MNNRKMISYNMLYNHILTDEQMKACNFYLTSHFVEDYKPSHILFINKVCEIFGLTADELAWALSKFRLYSNDIICIHCGRKYLLNEPVGYHQVPEDWENWVCNDCDNFINQPMQIAQIMDSYPDSNISFQDDDDEFIPPW